MTRTLITTIRQMAVEEWRMHSTLFGGKRFAVFPIYLFLISAITAFALRQIGVSLETLSLGVGVLAVFLGLQAGGIGFEGADALKNLLSDTTFLIYSTRTLPLSGSIAMLAFIIKDIGYYSVLFIFPLSLGTISGGSIGSEFLTHQTCINCTTTLPPISIFVGTVIKTLIQATGAFLGGMIVILLVAVTPLSIPSFNLSKGGRIGNGYERLSKVFGHSKTEALAVKTVIDVHRSSGGIWKLGLSSATLLGGSYAALEIVSQYTVLNPSYGVVFGVILSMTAFPTYRWLTRIDGPTDYQLYPVSGRELIQAKTQAFIALELLVVCLYYTITTVAFNPTFTDFAVGTVLLIGLLAYVFGLTVALTRFDPSELSFDTAVFTKYSLAIMTVLLPPLIIGLAVPITGVLALVVSVYGLLCLIGGMVIFNRASQNMSLRDNHT